LARTKSGEPFGKFQAERQMIHPEIDESVVAGLRVTSAHIGPTASSLQLAEISAL